MWRSVHKRFPAYPALVAILMLAFLQMGAAPKKKKAGQPPKTHETVGDIAFVMSRGEMKVEGVGLVVGLDSTGVDPPPTFYRKQLLDEMSKAGVEKGEKLLTNPQVSMVIVRLTIPVGVSPKDRLDAQVEVPSGCGTKSLAGGYLLTTRLREVLIAGGSPKESFDIAFAQGPVMIGTPAKPKDLKVGRVLGGAKVKKEHPYTLVIKENRESFRTSSMLEKVVNRHFHEFENGHQKGVATAKTPSFLVLKVPALYHQNQEHFFRVVQLLPMIESADLQVRRTAAWTKELLDPVTAGVAAMKLEGQGATSIEALKTGLSSTNAQVRFFSAESLAYLNDTAGIDALGETAIGNKNFRVYALAALAALDQPASHLKLRKLMDEPDIELRYGAFNALRTLDPHDPFLGLVRVLDEPKEQREDDDEQPDSMAIAITNTSRRRESRLRDPFGLYVVDSEGPPLVHISRSRRSEIVVFGRQQQLFPPIVLDTGSIFLNAAESDDKIELSKIVTSRYSDADVKLTSSLELAEVVRKMTSLGATYPQIVAVLENAKRQRNLAGDLVVDAVPVANRRYLEAVLGKDTTAKRDETVQRTSGETKTRRRLFGLFSRDGGNSLTGASTKNEPAKSSQNRAPTFDLTEPPKPSRAFGTSTNGKTDQGATPASEQSVKKDDAVQKAVVNESPQPRRRFIDFSRRNDEP